MNARNGISTATESTAGRASAAVCPVCDGADTVGFFDVAAVPTQDGTMWPSRQEAIHAPLGDISLVYCRSCQYIWNDAHDAGRIRFDRYDFSMQDSPAFQRFVLSLSRRLIAAYGIRGKNIVDVGCGDGHFLGTLCRMGGNKGLGIDPGHTPSSDGLKRVRFVRDYYSERYRMRSPGFISCRHVLNAVPDPAGFASLIRRTMNEKSILYLEVPNASYNFDGMLVWNVAYEHKSWFTAGSLRNLLSRSGFRVLSVRPCWGKEYLSVEAVPRTSPGARDARRNRPGREKEFERRLRAFAGTYRRRVRSLQNRLDAIAQSGLRTAIWGAGARTVTLLSVCHIAANGLRIVDINPKRQGMYLPHTGHRVWAPESLQEFRPEVIIISNGRFAPEIRRHARALGLACRFIVL